MRSIEKNQQTPKEPVQQYEVLDLELVMQKVRVFKMLHQKWEMVI